MALRLGKNISSTFEQKEKAKVQAQEDVKRQQQDRELLTQQEEEERQLRKKVIGKRNTVNSGTACPCALN